MKTLNQIKADKPIIFFNRIVLILTLVFLFTRVEAASRYWIATSTANWNDVNNWSTTSGGTGGASVPGSSDHAFFNSARNGNCTIDASISVYGMTISGYTGTVTQGSGYAITIGAFDFNMSTGTFTGGNATIDLNGEFNFTGGTFTATSGIMTLTATAWNHTTSGTFNHNNGTVIFAGNGTDYLKIVGSSETFYNLTVNKTTSGIVSLYNSGSTAIIAGTLTLSQGNLAVYTGTATLEARGNVLVSSTFGVVYDAVNLNFTETADQDFDLTNATDKIQGDIGINKSSGQVNLISDFVLSINGGFNFISGTLNINNKTVSSSGTAISTCTGTFTIIGSGNIALGGYSQTSGSPAFTINGASSFTIGAADFTISTGTFSCGDATVDFNGEFNFTGGTFTGTSGIMTLTASSWNHTTGGTFSHNNGTVIFAGNGSVNLKIVGGTETFNNLTINKTTTIALFNSGSIAIVLGTLTLSQGSVSGTATLEARGDVLVGTSFGTTGTSVTFNFTGSSSIQNFTYTGTTNRINGNITINKTSGKVNLGSGFTVYSGKSLTVTAGTLNCLNQVVSGATLTLASGATLELGSTGGIASSGATGNIQTTTRTFNTGSYYVYSGISGAQVTGTGLPSTIAGLTINNSSGVSLTASITINTLFNLTNGNLTVDVFNIIMASGSSISGGSSSSFVYTGSTGFLKYNSCAASSNKTFPVGHTNSSAGYIPLIITFNTGHTTDDFNVIAVDKVTNDGTRTGTAYTSTVVKAMWFITETTTGGSNVNMQFQWNGTDEASGFVRSTCHMSHYTNSAWENPGSNASASGSNPYTFTHNNYTGTFSPFGMGGSGGPLPVKLLFFNVKKENSTGLITWATAMEQDNDYFEIEKSVDSKIFNSIGKIDGAGNSQQILKYNFIDSELESGINYYRLKQTDYNGEFSYSDVKSISSNNENSETLTYKLYPVPTINNLTVELNSNRDLEETPIKIINAIGATVLEKNINLQSGFNQFDIDLNNLSGGIYFIQIDGVIGYKNTRFLINK